MPHITEEIWQTLRQNQGDGVLALQAYPQVLEAQIDIPLEKSFELVFGVIRTIRNLRAETALKPGSKITAILQTENDAEIVSLQPVTNYIKNIAKIEQLTITKTLPENLGQVIAGVYGTVQVIIPLTGIVDLALLRSKLTKNLAKVEKEVQSLSGRLNNPGFVNNAPAEVIQAAKESLAEAQKQVEILRNRLKNLE